MHPDLFKAIIPGSQYEILSVQGQLRVFIQFIHKEGDPLQVNRDGVTTEQVVAVLIDRIQYLDMRLPCEENKQIVQHLLDVATLLRQRTADRSSRDVEGTNNA